MLGKMLRCMAVVGAMAAATPAWATLSGNLFSGDFENVATLKNNYTFDNSNNPVGAHRFNADGQDFGLWIGRWGLQDLEQNGYTGQGGFSTHDYPRQQVGATMQGTPGVVADDISNNNRSLDPYNPTSGNHIMETVAFYPTMAQWVAAPANQTTGPMQLSFDFFLNHWWADGSWDYFDRFQIEVFGTNYLPPHNVGMGTDIPGTTFDGYEPTGGATSVDTTIDGVHYKGEMLARYGMGNWWSNELGYPETNGWKNRNSASPANWTEGVDAADQGSLIIPINLTETFDYYSVVVSTGIYGEGHEYFWMVPGYGVNGYSATDQGPAIGFDNIDFRVSTASPVPPCPWPWPFPWPGPIIAGDLNNDELFNSLDIAPFVQHLVTGDDAPECDFNGDGACDALDISKFVICIINGTCTINPCYIGPIPLGGTCGGEAGSTVPEPAAMALLTLAVVGGVWRRR